MTPRQRFHATMNFGRPERVPWLEEGLRDEVLNRWREQGLGPGADTGTLFHCDRRERIELDLRPHSGPLGLATSDAALARLRSSLDAADPSRLPADWPTCIQRWRQRDHILELPIHRGLFLTLGVDEWAGVEEALCLTGEDPAAVRRIMDVHARFTAALVDRILADVEVDFASISEPIADNHGPLVSPATYRQVALDSYQPVIAALKRHGVQTIVFATYGNARLLLPDVLAAGCNCLWAMETETEAMDYRALRRQFGKSLRLIGGIDLDAVVSGGAALETELRTKVPPLLGEGGYIPLADGRVRTNVPFAHYAQYRKLLERVTQGL
jgi:hypothetical protein